MSKCKVMLTEAYLESSRTSTMELFSFWLSHILKMYFSKLPLGSIFYTTHPFGKKPTTENFGRKSFVNNRTFFFLKFEIMQWNDLIYKGFLN